MASGKGSNLEAIILAGEPVALVIVDCECPAKQIAEKYGIPVKLIARRKFSKTGERVVFTIEILAALFEYRIDLVAMAGFMTILAKQMFRPYPEGYGGRILNSHPAPLRFKGAHAVGDILEAFFDG
jgi:folate-dependent phosphoribosylglycinamide formyltransferase PurN